eukprot:TRINITY_DN15218_c0_g1_i3.p1 TRINITY_DN15218_c0_g1~~TRINITY_DN15218_c0_g1_i3.p1  ORF type:complete len:517 (-),score=80.81 TRINITY_DN15218_c0_g1_i3:131-1681(-)
MGLRRANALDAAVKVCLLGVVTGLYLLARFSFEVDGSWESSVYLMRTLDGYAASIHPDKFDAGTDGGRRWPVTDAALGSLRRRLAIESSWRTTSTWTNSAGERFVGNIFGMQPHDEIEPGVNLSNAFSIYVYDVDDFTELDSLTKGAGFCNDNQWGFEVGLHEWFLSCPCRTDDPQKADFFFVPHYTACHLNVETFTEAQSDALFSSLVSKLPYFNRTQGRDHVFVWGGGFGADGPFRSWRKLAPDATFLMTEPELWNPYHDIDQASFSHHKDVLIPGRLGLMEVVSAALNAPHPRERPYLGDFVGWNRPLHVSQGGAADGSDSPRRQLLNLASVPDLHIRQDVPYAEASRGALTARFCFVPRGKSAWSSRFFRVLFSGCVPVLLNDYYDPPFDALLNVPDFVLRWPMRQVGTQLLDALRAVPEEAMDRLLDKAREARCWYVYPPPALDFEHLDLQKGKLDTVCPSWRSRNAYTAIMQLLRRRRRTSHTKAAGASFYMPDAGGFPVLFSALDDIHD